MAENRYWEFFEDDNGLRSMNRLATFSAISCLICGFSTILFFCGRASGTDLREYLGTLSTLGIIIAGLGGFNYAAGRVTGAYTDVRVAQANKGIQPQPTPGKLGPTTEINIGNQGKPTRKRRA